MEATSSATTGLDYSPEEAAVEIYFSTVATNGIISEVLSHIPISVRILAGKGVHISRKDVYNLP